MMPDRGCLTPGAVYKARIAGDVAVVTVVLPRAVTKQDEARRLEQAIHDALELGLAPLWVQHGDDPPAFDETGLGPEENR